MNIKDLAIATAISFITFFLLQNIFFKKDNLDIINDKDFLAPTSKIEMEPLNFEVDFSLKNKEREEKVNIIETKNAIFKFTNNGATINSLIYKNLLENKDEKIEIISPVIEKDAIPFLVALNDIGQTPYYYDFVDYYKSDNKHYISYIANSDIAIIKKNFIIYDDINKIDFNLEIEPLLKSNLKLRLMIPAPQLLNNSINTMKAVMFNGNEIVKKDLKTIKNFGKENPTIFGIETLYFASLLISDNNNFAKRAYYKIENSGLLSEYILETTDIREKSSWNLSFYIGPKLIKDLSQLDVRLEKLLDYGWFSFICKIILNILNFFHSIFNSYGLAIIVVTIFLKLLLLPFTYQSLKSRNKAAELQKKFQYLSIKYKDDPEALNLAKAEFIKKHGFPGSKGILALFLQLPVMIALNRVLNNSIQLYKAPLFWIDDLSSYDPYYILPILTGFSLFIQFMFSYTKDARSLVFSFVTSIIFTALISNASAGLALFIFVGALFSLIQNYIQNIFNL